MRLSGDPSSRLIASDFDGESRRLLLLGENASREPKILWWEIGREASVPHSRPLGAPAYIVAPPCIGRNIAAFVDKENKVKLYDPLTGELGGTLGSPAASDLGIARLYSLSADGRVLAGLSALNKFHFWDITSGRELARLDAVRCSRMRVEPPWVATGRHERPCGSDRSDPCEKRAGELASQARRSFRCAAASLSFSADERLLAINVVLAAGEPQAAGSLGSCFLENHPCLPGPEGYQQSRVHSGLPRRCTHWGNKPRIWRLDPPQAPGTLAGHSDEAWSAAFSPDGKLLATGSDDTDEPNTIKLWDPATGRLLAGWKAHTATVVSLAFSPDGRYLASSSLDEGKPGSRQCLGLGRCVPQADCATSRAMTALSVPWRSAPTAACWPPQAMMLRSGSGTPPIFRVALSSQVTPPGSDFGRLQPGFSPIGLWILRRDGADLGCHQRQRPSPCSATKATSTRSRFLRTARGLPRPTTLARSSSGTPRRVSRS